MLAGPLMLSIPPGQSTQTGQCTIEANSTIFNIAPHMHRLGVHMKVVADRSGAASSVLFDDDYSFDSQLRYSIDPIDMKAGDVLHVTCTYENTTVRNVQFGQSTDNEMCFAGFNRYPALGDNYLCSN